LGTADGPTVQLDLSLSDCSDWLAEKSETVSETLHLHKFIPLHKKQHDTQISRVGKLTMI